MAFRESFNFGADTAIRFEGDPSTFTTEKLELLAKLGCTKLSSGVQSFSDAVLRECGRKHTAQMCIDFIRAAQRARLRLDQRRPHVRTARPDAGSVRLDLQTVLDHELTAVVCTTLHLRSYANTRSGAAGVQPAAWQMPDYRDRLAGQRAPLAEPRRAVPDAGDPPRRGA